MSSTDKSQTSSGKQGTAKFRELSEWDKILLDGIDNDGKWFIHFREQRKLAKKQAEEQQEK